MKISMLLSLAGLAAAVVVPATGRTADDYPAPIKAIAAQGVEIIGRFSAPGGVTGYAAVVGQRPLAIYVTADGKYAIVGTMVDGEGNDLSQQPLDKLVKKPLTVRTWKQLEGSTWVADGDAKAPRVVYVFTDPNCPYCRKFWEDARPWVEAGKVQLRHILVGILRPSSAGKAAAILADKQPEAALGRDERAGRQGGIPPMDPIPPRIQSQLDANERLMQQLGSYATPTIFYKDDDGDLQSAQGAPSAQMLAAILGRR